MNNHKKKMIAPVVVVLGVLFAAARVFFANGKFVADTSKIVVLVVSLIMTVLLVVVLVERIKEIQRGEEDDLSQY
jgi:predicted anti-sigma-YlaC factor YlaD